MAVKTRKLADELSWTAAKLHLMPTAIKSVETNKADLAREKAKEENDAKTKEIFGENLLYDA